MLTIAWFQIHWLLLELLLSDGPGIEHGCCHGHGHGRGSNQIQFFRMILLLCAFVWFGLGWLCGVVSFAITGFGFRIVSLLVLLFVVGGVGIVDWTMQMQMLMIRL